jgi:23S rRNA pseudouridine1911/1915/1917 synthase
MRKRVFVRASQDPVQLLAMLAERLRDAAVDVAQLLAAGAVHVDGARASHDQRLATGAKIVIFLDPAPERPSPLPIVYQDDWIVIVDKPAGMPSQAERAQRAHSAQAQVEAQVAASARLIHRLDKEASGLLLFAREQRACAPLQTALTAGAIDRRYVAIVDGELVGDGTIELRIARHSSDPRLRAALPQHAPAGEPARSHWRALTHARLGDRPCTALELRLDTGRTHQLRVHLSAIGHPIVGDTPYGGPPFERLCLHAHRLALPHPRNGEARRFDAAVPPPLARLAPDLTTSLP